MILNHRSSKLAHYNIIALKLDLEKSIRKFTNYEKFKTDFQLENVKQLNKFMKQLNITMERSTAIIKIKSKKIAKKIAT